MVTRNIPDPRALKLVQEVLKLAKAEGIDLTRVRATEFVPRLEDWILRDSLVLPDNHPLKRGGFTFTGDVPILDALALADDQFRLENALINLPDEAPSATPIEPFSIEPFPSDPLPIESLPVDPPPLERLPDDMGPVEVDPEGFVVDIDGTLYRRDGDLRDGEELQDSPASEIFTNEPVPPCRKIAVVPGILGSEIIEVTPRPNLTDDWKKIWPPISADPNSVAPLDHLVDTNSDLNLPDAPQRQANILESAYDGLLGRLRRAGYTEKNGKLHPWGYDWTKSNLDNGRLLKAFINDLAGVTPEKPEGDCAVDVICHSMGGLVTRAALKLGAKVRRTVYLASPHHGAPKAYYTLHPGAPVPLASAWWKRFLINKLWDSYAQEVQPKGEDLGQLLSSFARQFPSVFELLPDEFYFGSQRSFVTLWYRFSSAAVVGLDATYYSTDYVKFPRKDGLRSKVQQAMRFKKWLGRLPPGEHLSIYSKSEDTKDTIVYDTRIGFRGFNNPKDSGQKGDGTVPTNSARVGSKLRRVNGSHVAVPNRQDTFHIIAGYLKL